jgi:hypothetical protein
MWEHYLRALTPQGQIVTCQRGMDASQADCGGAMTYAELVRLEARFPCQVSELRDGVYALHRRGGGPC